MHVVESWEHVAVAYGRGRSKKSWSFSTGVDGYVWSNISRFVSHHGKLQVRSLGSAFLAMNQRIHKELCTQVTRTGPLRVICFMPSKRGKPSPSTEAPQTVSGIHRYASDVDIAKKDDDEEILSLLDIDTPLNDRLLRSSLCHHRFYAV